MKFDIRDYESRGGNVDMHCSTKEESDIFLTYLNECGKSWVSGDSYLTPDRALGFGSKTCYYFNNGTYGSFITAKKKGREILEFSDFEWDEEEIDIDPEDDEIFAEFMREWRCCDGTV